jgi:hypothetical protein
MCACVFNNFDVNMFVFDVSKCTARLDGPAPDLETPDNLLKLNLTY